MATMTEPTQSEKLESTTNRSQLRLTKRSAGYWRVTIDNPPINVMGPQMIKEFQKVMEALENDEHVRVVVFDSAVEEIGRAHV